MSLLARSPAYSPAASPARAPTDHPFAGGLVLPSAVSGLLNWNRADTGLKTGGARQFTAANGEYFSVADNTLLSGGDVDFSIAVWVYLDSVGSNRGLVAKDGGTRGYTLSYSHSSTAFFWGVPAGTSTTSTITPATGTWYFLVAQYTAATNTYSLSVNDGTADTASGTAPTDTANAFQVGAQNGASHHDGRISRLLFSKAVLTAAEITWLYNNGNGRTGAEINSHATLGPIDGTTSEYWALNEDSGNALSFSGSNDLTDNNTVTAADGPAVEIAADETSNDSHAVIEGSSPLSMWSTDVVSGASGLSLKFNGTDNTARLDDQANITNTAEITIRAWVKTTNTSMSMVAGINGNYLLAVLANGKVDALLATDDDPWHWLYGAAGVGSAINDGTWHHVALTYKTGEAKIYIDGTQQGATVTTTTGDTISSSNKFYVGSDNGSANWFDGGIDDLAVDSAVLSSDNITYFYNSHRGVSGGTNPGDANQQVYYKFDDGPQSPVADADPIIEWRSKEGDVYQFLQATAAKRPAAALASNGINGKDAVEFDGSNLLVLDSAPLEGKADLTLVIAIETGSTAFSADQVIFATSDEGTATTYMCVGIDSAGKVYVEVDNAGTTYRGTGDTVLSTSSTYVITVRDDDTAWGIDVNETAQSLTDTGSYEGINDISGLDNTTLGALKHTSEVDHFEGKIADSVLYNPDLDDTNESKVEDYATARYGV